jgi:fructokinase
VNWISTLSPERIILGGGVMRHEGLLEDVRTKVAALLNEYVSPPGIVPPGLGERSGVLGAIALAEAVALFK